MSPEPTLCGRFPRSIFPLLVSLFVLLCLGISPAFSATQTVSKLTDDGTAGTLRNAISAAAAGDTIAFNVTGTITLSSGILTISKSLAITGPSGGITVNGAAASGVIAVTAGTVTISSLTLTNGNASFGNGNGGGLYITGGEVTLEKCTISGNTATNGGGIYNAAALSMTNCTVSGNTASGNGGGIYNSGLNPSLLNCTITQNTASNGGGYCEGRAGTGEGANILNCIISNNTASSNSSIANPSGNITSLGNNLVGNNPIGTPFSTSNGDIISNAPGLGPLASNGGPTQTHALLSGSAAIDAGTNSGAPTTDQRGENRPQDGNGDGVATTDIGAYELVPSVGASDTPPAANAQYVSLPKTGNKTVAIILSGSDQEGDTLTYSIVQNPSVGTLSGTPPNVTYTWNGGSTYLDSFTFRAYDGYHYSSPATVKIEAVEGASNMPAVAHNKVVSTPSGTAKSITLSGSNFEGTSFTYTITKQPSYGTLSGTAPNVTYTPNSGYSGADVFYYSVKDSDTPDRSSEPAWVYIYVGTLSVPSLPPVADAGPDKTTRYAADLDGSRSFDPAGRTLTYQWSGTNIKFGSPNSAITSVDNTWSYMSGTYTATLGVTTTPDSKSASDTVQYQRTPGYDNLAMILLALFWAFIGVRYIRRGAAKKR